MKLSSHLSAHLLGIFKVLGLDSQIILTSRQLLRDLLLGIDLLQQQGNLLLLSYCVLS